MNLQQSKAWWDFLPHKFADEQFIEKLPVTHIGFVDDNRLGDLRNPRTKNYIPVWHPTEKSTFPAILLWVWYKGRLDQRESKLMPAGTTTCDISL